MQSLYSSLLLGLLGATLVLTSCGDKKEQAAKELETSGYQITPEDFLRAAENGDVKALELFVKNDMDLGTKDANGWTALHLAARANRQESIAFLLESGMNVDTTGLDGVTPVMLAAREGNASMVRYLIKQGAKPELKDDKNRSALILAVEGNHKTCVEELAPYLRSQLDTALLYAASKGKHRVIDSLTSYGASVYVRHSGGMTPLMLAAQHGHDKTIKALLDSGSNRYAVNEHGWTAAQVAGAAGKDDIAAVLSGAPTEADLAITEPTDEEGVEWVDPETIETDTGAEPVDSTAVAADTTTEGPDTTVASNTPKPIDQADEGDMPWNRPTGPEEGGPLDKLLPKRVPGQATATPDDVAIKPAPVRKHLPFIAGKKIATKGQTSTAVAKDLVMLDYQQKPLPLIVEKTSAAGSGGGSKAQVRQLYGKQKKVEVAEGEMIPDTRFKIVSIRRMLNHSKVTDGQPADVSVVEIEDTKTGKRRKMTAKIPATASEPWAVLRSRSSGETYAVRAGQKFTSADGQHFTVTDVRPNQLVITANDSGEVSTIPLGK